MNPKAPDIANFLQHARWYRFKSKKRVRTEVLDEYEITQNSKKIILTFLKLFFSDNTETLYFIPLQSKKGKITDAFSDPLFQKWVLAQYSKQSQITLSKGKLRFFPFGKWTDGKTTSRDFKTLSAEQSNSSFVYKDRAIIKFYRQIEPGNSCEMEMEAYLTELGFKNMPRLMGEIHYSAPDGTLYSLGLAAQYFPKSHDGWHFLLSQPKAPDFEKLGQVTGKMHVLLAQATPNAAFNPEPVSEQDKAIWFAQFQQLLETLIAGLMRQRQQTPLFRKQLDLIFFNQELMRNKAQELLKAIPPACHKIRCHGDYHLGQTLRTAKEWILLDFEGEPMRTPEERKQKYPPQKDVAGMLRSIDYMGHTLALNKQITFHKKEDWVQASREHFLSGYAQAISKCPALTLDGKTDKKLLNYYELDKVIYELNYELNNRPGWLGVPLNGIEKILPRI